ncbi:MAG: hypothetical protein V1744_06980 [Candidatus Altiarchaeota archaeon]
MEKHGKEKSIWLFLAIGLVLTLAISLYQIAVIQKSFNITSVAYSPDGVNFRPINLPSFVNEGYFMINFTTDRRNLNLYLFADDCIEYGYLNGAKFSGGECTPCKHCRGVLGKGTFDPAAGRQNTLLIKTRKISGGTPFFVVENEENDVVWRALAVLSIMALSILIYSRVAGRDLRTDVKTIRAAISKRHGLALVLLMSLAVQLAMTPWGQSRDIVVWLIRAENIIHKGDWSFTRTAPDYLYMEETNMCKPPGAYLYEFIILRLLFGFNHIYTTFLVKLPPIAGNLLVGYAVWSILMGRVKNKRIPLVAASLYVLNPVVILQAAYLGKHDSLVIGFLLMALKNLAKRRFSLYYGLAVLGKQFPLLMAPWILLQRGMIRKMILAGCVFVILAFPFLLDNPMLFFERLIKTSTEKAPSDLSWMINLKPLGEGFVLTASKVFLGIYFLTVVLVAFAVAADAYAMGAIVFTLFAVFSKVVFEQYVLWSLPFLIITYYLTKKRTTMAAFIIGSVSCAINNEDYRMLPENLANLWNILLALTYLAAAVDLARTGFTPRKVRDRVHAAWQKLK